MLVVHGGLSRQRTAKLSHWRKVNHRRQCPEDPSTMEEYLFFDACWADPCEERGVNYTSSRGAGCINFGPDVTRAFLERNGLDMLVRSHEVPHGSRGYMSHHGGRCYTVFSASNYCGRTGNYGSVALFFNRNRHHRQQLEFKIQEHFAPSLEDLARAPFVELEKEMKEALDDDDAVETARRGEAADDGVQTVFRRRADGGAVGDGAGPGVAAAAVEGLPRADRLEGAPRHVRLR